MNSASIFKKIFVILSLIIGLNFQVQAEESLTIMDKALVLRYLNDLCPDAWCEGEYNLKFRQIYEADAGNGRVHAILLLATHGYGENDQVIEFNCFVEDAQFLKNAAYSIQSKQYGDSTRQLYQLVNACILDQLYK